MGTGHANDQGLTTDNEEGQVTRGWPMALMRHRGQENEMDIRMISTNTTELVVG
ncbi:hypothetical protein PAXRUDRAFT_834661 [Paxillus rubicundulus Ve08.2h10]|uniref:Unplaced genomic scaffold scaffold_1844, whole genome shotgun sequence n=1 Tax=Paxillus rubicundulus Ve08.2h10 TaxID=930991 RepID=A0A0D0C4Z0_9AGAM|nr:hypothetical protein PAXRUDRAFT_834661 [Paxillus rubicundulus Ve08.2h10]